jgi:hypothetical protein
LLRINVLALVFPLALECSVPNGSGEVIEKSSIDVEDPSGLATFPKTELEVQIKTTRRRNRSSDRRLMTATFAGGFILAE